MPQNGRVEGGAKAGSGGCPVGKADGWETEAGRRVTAMEGGHLARRW